MSNISTTMRTFWVSRLEAYLAQLDAAETALAAAMTEIESYSLDTGIGRQSTKYRDVDKLQKTVDNLITRIVWVNAKINGGGLVNLDLRRRG